MCQSGPLTAQKKKHQIQLDFYYFVTLAYCYNVNLIIDEQSSFS